jgi:hypothetical protein
MLGKRRQCIVNQSRALVSESGTQSNIEPAHETGPSDLSFNPRYYLAQKLWASVRMTFL